MTHGHRGGHHGHQHNHHGVPDEIRRQLDDQGFEALGHAIIAMEKASYASGYARAVRDCTAALVDMKREQRVSLLKEPAVAAIISFASLGVATLILTAAYLTGICRL